MSKFYVREGLEVIDEIVVAEQHPTSYNITSLKRSYADRFPTVILDTKSYALTEIINEEDAKDLIKGIQKAIDLGWFQEHDEN